MAIVPFTSLLTGSSSPLLAAGDILAFVDVSDATQSASGSTVKATLTQFFAAIPVPIVFAVSEKSVTAFATPLALSATQYTAFASTVSGATLMGFGTTGDVTLKNRAGTDVLVVTSNTLNVALAGALAITGALTGATTGAFSSNLTVGGTAAVTGAVTLSSTLAVTGATTLASLGVTGNLQADLRVAFRDAAAPGNAADGWYVYSEAGTLKAKNSAGTVRTLAAP